MNENQSVTALELQPLADEDLSPANRDYLQVCRDKLGMVPNVLTAFGFDDRKLSNFIAYSDEVLRGESGLSRMEREMVAVAVSAVNRCVYCLTSHGAALRQASGDPVFAELIAMNYRAADLTPRQRAMLDFAVKLTKTPEEIDEPDREALRKAGLSERDIWDLGAVAAFFNMTNRLALAVDMRPNDAYHFAAREQPEEG